MTIRNLYIGILLLVLPFISYGQECVTTLPHIYIDTDEAVIGQEVRTPATITIVSAAARDSILLPSHPVGIKVRGKTAAQYPKKSYSLEFVDSTQAETDVSLLGMRSDDDWILDAMYIDHARMRNRLCTDIWNAYNRIPHHAQEPEAINGTRGTFVEVFLNGQYNGLYCLTERIDRKQLKLKKYKDEHRGVSYKAVTWDNLMGYCSYNPQAPVNSLLWNGFESEYPGETSKAGWEYLQEFLEFLSPDYTSDEIFADGIHQHIHLDNLIDYTLLVNALYALDNVVKNLYLSIYNVQNDHRVFFTPWDMDATFGRTYDGTLIDQYAFTGSVPFGNQLITRLWEGNVNGFKQTLMQRWDELKHTSLSPDSIASRIHAYQKLFESSGAFAREQARWPELCAEDLSEETDYMISWYARNVELIDSTLRHATTIESQQDALYPQFHLEGQNLIVNCPNAMVTLYNIEGEMLYNAFEDALHSIILPHKGFYIIHVVCDDNSYTYKIYSAGR